MCLDLPALYIGWSEWIFKGWEHAFIFSPWKRAFFVVYLFSDDVLIRSVLGGVLSQTHIIMLWVGLCGGLFVVLCFMFHEAGRGFAAGRSGAGPLTCSRLSVISTCSYTQTSPLHGAKLLLSSLVCDLTRTSSSTSHHPASWLYNTFKVIVQKNLSLQNIWYDHNLLLHVCCCRWLRLI